MNDVSIGIRDGQSIEVVAVPVLHPLRPISCFVLLESSLKSLT